MTPLQPVSVPPEGPPALSTEAPKSVVEAPVIKAPSKEASPKKEVNDALEEMGKLLLKDKDPRIGTVALARLAGDTDTTTPMGAELRSELVTALQKDKGAPESIKNLSLLDKPEKSAFAAFLTANADKLPPEVASQLTLDINSGRLTIGELATTMQSYAPIRELFLNELLGENHAKLNTAGDMLTALHIEQNADNLQLVTETFKPDKTLTTKTGGHFDSMLAVSIGMILFQSGITLAQQEEQAQTSRGGH